MVVKTQSGKFAPIKILFFVVALLRRRMTGMSDSVSYTHLDVYKRQAVECPYELKEGVWPDMASSSAMEGVLGSGSAKYFSAGSGK